MRILIAHMEGFGKTGGIETCIKNLITFLDKELYVCYSKRKHSKKIKKIKINGKKFSLIEYEKPWVSKSKKHNWPFLHQKSFEKRLKEFTRENFDFDLMILMHSCLVGDFSGFTKAKICFIMPSSNKDYFHSIKKDIKKNDKKVWENLLKIEKKIMENKKITIFILSKLMKTLIFKNYNVKAKIKIINPGVASIKQKKLKKTIDVLTVCRIDPVKNLILLINISKIFGKNKFVVVGDGRQKKELIKIKKKKKIKNILFIGKRKNPFPYYLKSKIFVLTSKYESFGLVLLEAMSSGLPCIAFKPDGKKIITASNEIIKNKVTGFLVKNEKEMAEKIDILLKDNKLREKMSKEARKEAKKYSWKKTAKEILELARD